MGIPWAYHGQLTDSPRTAHGQAMGNIRRATMDNPRTAHGQPTNMSNPWANHWQPVGNPWAVHWNHEQPTGKLTDSQLATHGQPMGNPRTAHGQRMGIPWTTCLLYTSDAADE